jgi:hypothetical protein
LKRSGKQKIEEPKDEAPAINAVYFPIISINNNGINVIYHKLFITSRQVKQRENHNVLLLASILFH